MNPIEEIDKRIRGLEHTLEHGMRRKREISDSVLKVIGAMNELKKQRRMIVDWVKEMAEAGAPADDSEQVPEEGDPPPEPYCGDDT